MIRELGGGGSRWEAWQSSPGERRWSHGGKLPTLSQVGQTWILSQHCVTVSKLLTSLSLSFLTYKMSIIKIPDS